MEVKIGNIKFKEPIKIGNIKIGIKKIYPELEDLEVKPSGQEQVFKSDKYGYGEVAVNAVESEELEIVPGAEKQVREGLFNKVTISGDNNLVPENIKEGTSIFGVEGTITPSWDTSQIRQCYNMFQKNTEMIEAPYFNTSNVTRMSNMFDSCSNLETVPEFNTSNVTDMSYMFYYCSNLETVPEFNTSNVTDMRYMFYSCRNLETVPQFDATNVTNMSSVFQLCSNLTELGGLLDLGKGYNQKQNNFTTYKLDLHYSNNLTHQSLMNAINNLYDLNLTYDVANGGTLYTQSLQLGSTNLAKLTEEEIAIATEKGWTVS